MFKINPLFLTDGYKPSHKFMLAPGTTRLYGTWIPRSLKHAPKGITKIVSFNQQLTWKYIHDVFEEHFFFTKETKEAREKKDFQGSVDYIYKPKALQFVKDMSLYLGMKYDGKHFEELWDLGYLPIRVKSLPEGLETGPNIPHMTFVNTVDGFAWLTLFLETIVSNLAWKAPTAATIAKLYRRQAEEAVAKTDPANMWLVDYMCHDFSARGLSGPYDMIAVGLGHATSFRGSDTLVTWFEVKEPNNCKCQKEGINPLTEDFCCDNYHDNPPDWCLLNSINVGKKKSYNIYKDPVTDDGVKRSLKGLLQVKLVDNEYIVNQECSWEQEEDSELRTIYENGIFKNQVTLQDVRNNLTKI